MIESQSLNAEVTQPRPFDPSEPRCREHRGVPSSLAVAECDSCAGAAEWVLRRCGMCDRSGQRWDPATHIPVSPYRSCDHSTEHAVVVAEITAAESAVAAAMARPRVLPPVPSTIGGRRRAQAIFRGSRKVRPQVPVQRRASGDVVVRESVRPGLAHAAAGASGKGGLDAAPSGLVETTAAGVTA